MSDQPVQFESSDIVGSTNSFGGTVGTSWIPVPAIAGAMIQSVTVMNDQSNQVNDTLFISLDGGVSEFDEIYSTGHISHTLKGGLTQIWIKGSNGSVKYKVILDREA